MFDKFSIRIPYFFRYIFGMAVTQFPKLYLICALLALSVYLMKGFIDSCSTQSETTNIISKYANFPNFPNANAQLKYSVMVV